VKSNGLEDGEDGCRILAKQKVASEEDWNFDSDERTSKL
jgi:hypothetical protein